MGEGWTRYGLSRVSVSAVRRWLGYGADTRNRPRRQVGFALWRRGAVVTSASFRAGKISEPALRAAERYSTFRIDASVAFTITATLSPLFSFKSRTDLVVITDAIVPAAVSTMTSETTGPFVIARTVPAS